MKKLFKAVLDKLGEHLAVWIATGVVAGLTALSVVFWEWLKTEHSIRAYGWTWVVAASVVGGLPSLIFWFVRRKRVRILYREDEEISVVLEHKLRTYEREKKNEILIDFRSCDAKWRLPKGSAKKLLPELVQKDKVWRVKVSGGNAMTIVREDPKVAVLKDLAHG